MLYQTFRTAGYFIGSGVVEAGCKVVVGQRLKHMLVPKRRRAPAGRSVRFAEGWFEDFWKAYTKSGHALAFAA